MADYLKVTTEKRLEKYFDKGQPKAAGIYCVQPPLFSTKYKFGKSSNLAQRLDSYCHTWPTGYKIFALLRVPAKQEGKAETLLFNIADELGYERIPAACGGRSEPTEWLDFAGQSETKRLNIIWEIFTRLKEEIGGSKEDWAQPIFFFK